jgi:N-acetylneuraminic acid mutarotase
VKRLSSAVFALSFVLVVVGIQPLFAQVQGQWASSGTMQSARKLNAQVLLSNGEVLSIGGVDNSGNLLASSELYSSTSGKWTLTGSMSQARQVFPAVVLSNKKVLVSGGLGASGTVLAAAELYDPTTGAWSSAGSLSVARFAHTATLLQNGKVLVAGGCTVSNCTDTVVGELYDPTSNSWSTTGNLNTARSYHTAVRLKTGTVLVIGGFPGLVSCELYDPTKGTWTNASSTNAGRYLNTTTLLPDGKVLVTGGANGRFPVNSAELYDPTANTWTYTGNMKIGRYAHTATLLSDGTVLVPGGVGQPISCGKDCTSYIPTNKVDIYSEANGAFTASASLSQPQANQSTTLLKTGGALQAGGIGTTNICCLVLNTAQIYTPLTLTFSASSLNFGLLQVGMTSPSQTVTVTNVSNHSVKFSSIAASGEFSESHTCLSTLASGQNCTITVTFKPTVAGTQNSAVKLKDNCPGSPTQTISLTGTGETLALGFTPGSLNLGSVAVGSSITQSATLTNDGSAAVNLTGYSISPADGTFTQTNNCPATLNVQQTCTFQITFTPPDVFTYNATLSVTNSAGAPATLALTGTGLDGG